jgi:tRNA (cytidine56-2'-O)-methyltransferase
LITILRIGHRYNRDKRITSHLALVARALGARKMIVAGENDPNLKESITKINAEWGGNFQLEIVPYDEWKDIILGWKTDKKKIVHLTMYGGNLPNFKKLKLLDELRQNLMDVRIILGGEKVPAKVFQYADWNVAISNQPHSEVGALAIFLDHLFPNSLNKSFDNPQKQIIPSLKGKKNYK